MGKLFNLDNPLMVGLSRLFDLVVLNFVFIITCLPIVTIGASTTALYYVTLKVARGEEPYIIKSYFKSFRENFKQATIVWIIVALVWFVLFIDFRAINLVESNLTNVFRIIFVAISVICFCMTIYVFPAIARFSCSLKQVFRNTFVFAFGHFPKTALLILIYAILYFIIFYNVTTLSIAFLVVPLLGFSSLAYGSSFIIKTIFKHYEPEDDTL